ncbi:MAG: hypothetical protein ACYS5V_08790 [Planctomycetota bacterium]|jgi:hypothetical protein
MDASKPKTSDWMHRLIRDLQRDRKKAVILGALSLVAVVLIARALLKAPPKPARAAVPAPAEPAANHGAAETISPLAGWLRTEPQDGRARREEYLARMDRRIARDLFKPNLTYFPTASGGDGVAVIRASTGPGWFGRIRELVAQRNRTLNAQRTRESNIRAEARSLSLTSTVMGMSPMAVINGRVLRVGQTIIGFRLVSVSSRKCALMKDGVTVELYMKARK